jgi:hypothetical protein
MREKITPPRPSPEAILESGQSMLGGNPLPIGYGRIESATDAAALAFPKREHAVRLTIIWDNEVNTLDLERALEYMRETGAAFVLKVEPL